MRRCLLTSLFSLALFVFISASCSRERQTSTPDPKEKDPEMTEFYFGVDLSYVNQIEDNGGSYKNAAGEISDPYLLLEQHGANLARIRIWHNPEWSLALYDQLVDPYSAYKDVEKSINKAKNAGMDVLLDFHYSDTWADPGHQDIPAAWEAITDINVLADSVYNYTYQILDQLRQKNLLPEMVQIGNETNCGMMVTNRPENFPNLDICNGNWVNFGKIINAGIRAVRDIDALAKTETVIILHVADPKNLDYWTRDIMDKGKVTDFDIMGVSYYHIWHTTVGFNALPELISGLITKYKKDIMVLETAYPFTKENADAYNNLYYNQEIVEGFPYTVDGQKAFLTALHQNMMDAGALGVIYWEPAWITSRMTDRWGTGSSWENCAFFDFDGVATEVLEYLSHPYEREGK